jgi:hypothetical protein
MGPALMQCLVSDIQVVGVQLLTILSVDLDPGDDPRMNDPGTSESHALGANQLQQAKTDIIKSPETARTPPRKILLSHHIRILSQQSCSSSQIPAAFTKEPEQGVISWHSCHRLVTFTSC